MGCFLEEFCCGILALNYQLNNSKDKRTIVRDATSDCALRLPKFLKVAVVRFVDPPSPISAKKKFFLAFFDSIFKFSSSYIYEKKKKLDTNDTSFSFTALPERESHDS